MGMDDCPRVTPGLLSHVSKLQARAGGWQHDPLTLGRSREWLFLQGGWSCHPAQGGGLCPMNTDTMTRG